MTEQEMQVLVIGAGYAGMMAALRLAGKTRDDAVKVTLINRQEVFIQRPQLVHLLVEQRTIEIPVLRMLRGTPVHFVQGQVSGLDLKMDTATVSTPSGSRQLPYDYLIYTPGSSIDQESVPGVSEYAYFINPGGLRSVVELRQELVRLSAKTGRVVVVGGGATGIEVVTEIRSAYPNLEVSLVTDGEFGAFRGERVKSHLRQAFLEQGIPVYEQRVVVAVKEREIVTASGEAFPYELCVWTGGFRPPSLAREAGLAVNARGQVLIDPFGRSISHPEVFAAGDASFPLEEPGVPVRMGIFPSLTMAAHAVDNLCAALHDKPQKPLSFAYYGQGISLGPNDAVGLLTYPDDQPRGPIFRGRLAVQIRELAIRLVAFLLEVERRVPGSFFWLRAPRKKLVAGPGATKMDEQGIAAGKTLAKTGRINKREGTLSSNSSIKAGQQLDPQSIKSKNQA